MGEWTLFSNHGHVLVCLAKNNEARLRDVAAEVGITERAVQNILRELQQAGLVTVSKHGRCNHYQINSRKHLRHPLESHCTVGKLLQLLIQDAQDKAVQPPDAVPETKQAEPASPTPAAYSPKPAASEQHAVPVSAKPQAAVTSANRSAETDKKVAVKTPDEPGPIQEQVTKESPAPEKAKENPAVIRPKADEQSSGEVPTVEKSTSKPEPAKSKNEAVKKDSKKTVDNPSSQQGSLF